jgi:hypothetical protein
MKTKIVSTLLFALASWPTAAQTRSEQPSKTENLNFQKMEQTTHETQRIMVQFNNAFQMHDPALLTDLVAEDCVMESIQGPEGIRYEGYSSCYEFWAALATDPNTHFDAEEIFAYGDRATIKWRYHWGKKKDQAVRGVNLMKVKNGKIVEALGYAKTVSTTGLDANEPNGK